MLSTGTFVTSERKTGRYVSDLQLSDDGTPVIINGHPIVVDREEVVYDLLYYNPEDETDLRKPVKTIFTEVEKEKLTTSGHSWVVL